VGPSAVRTQLYLILQSEWFAQSERMRRFLEFVTEETLAGRADQLCEYTIGLAVFDQHASFDPAQNPIVRNDARRLRHKLHEYYRHMRVEADRVLIDMPKGAYIPVFYPVPPADFDSGQEAPRMKLRVAVLRNGSQVCGLECECGADETFDIQLSLLPLPD
jgi:serine/threonine-protein kinase